MLSGDRRATAGSDGRSTEPETTYNEDMPVEKLLEAELAVEPTNTEFVDSSVCYYQHTQSLSFAVHRFHKLKLQTRDVDDSLYHVLFVCLQTDAVANICQAADKQLFTLVEWAKRIPHFQELPMEDQVILLRSGD